MGHGAVSFGKGNCLSFPLYLLISEGWAKPLSLPSTTGIFDGITGVVAQPIKGAMQEGAAGFAKARQ